MRWRPGRRAAVLVAVVAAGTGVFAPRLAASGRPEVHRVAAAAPRVASAVAPSTVAAPVATTTPAPATAPTIGSDRRSAVRVPSSAATSTFTAPGLGVPAPKPGDGTTLALVPFARLRIPALGLDQLVHEGIAANVIDAGPAHWPGTAVPGAAGNVVIAGHRTSHTAPFRRVGELRDGDTIEFERADGVVARYAVYEQFVVSNTARWITGQAVDPATVPAGVLGHDRNGHPAILTVFTCHPIGSSRERLVTRAVLVALGRSA